jgi:hypothetical protein
MANEIDEQQSNELDFSWKLVREHDGRINYSNYIKWKDCNIDNESLTYTSPAVNRYLIMENLEYYIFGTDCITTLVEVKDDYVKFQTTIANYELFKLK